MIAVPQSRQNLRGGCPLPGLPQRIGISRSSSGKIQKTSSKFFSHSFIELKR